MKTLRVRPVLIETNDKSRICHLSPKGIEYNDLRFHEIECQIILDSINYDIVLVSLYDCAKYADMYYDHHTNLVLKATEYTDHKVYLYKKVIANQRQFSDELTEKLVEEYNNAGMKDFDIEMNIVTMYKSADKCEYNDIIVNDEIVDSIDYTQIDLIDTTIEKYNKPKLTKEGYIIPVINTEIQIPLNVYINQKHNQDRCIGFIDGYETKQSETVNIIRNIPYPIIYTEDDVRILFKNWIKLKSDEVGLQNISFDEWFETVKKIKNK